ncbi:MAG: helix-turn-helix domain-containing protein [Lachnospiraceae bacterium]|nr:helix-turn-helix domain-containing protein [Lachnospiraceae bacterium]
MTHKYLTVKDIQEALHIGHNAAYALMSLDGFPSVKVGRKYLVDEEALHKWLSEHKGTTVYLTP